MPLLLRCPFCDSFCSLGESSECCGHNECFTVTYVVCNHCYARGPSFSDWDYPTKSVRLQLAADAWNERLGSCYYAT